MSRLAGYVLFLVAGMLIVGCASTPDHSPTGRSGMDRVSPVRAAEVNTRLGIGYLERGQLQLAMEKLQTALQHDSVHVPAHVTLALIYEQVGDERQARRHYQQATRHAPDDGATLNSYAAFLCRQGEYERAEQHFEQATRDPFYATPEVALTNAGTCARRAGDLESAEARLRRALSLDPEYPDALYHLAHVYFQQDDAFRARAFLQRLEATGQIEPRILMLGYQIESRLGNSSHANQYVAQLEEQFPDSSEARELRQRPYNDD